MLPLGATFHRMLIPNRPTHNHAPKPITLTLSHTLESPSVDGSVLLGVGTWERGIREGGVWLWIWLGIARCWDLGAWNKGGGGWVMEMARYC